LPALNLAVPVASSSILMGVTSAHTDVSDRTTKAELYPEVPSLLAYLIVSQRAARLTCWSRPTTAATGVGDGHVGEKWPCTLVVSFVAELA
jgi:hypothetical protein